jgi:hypothetical protein
VTGDYDGGGRGSASGGDVGTHEHAGAELVEDALGFGLAGSCGFALETADGETLLGDGVSDVGGVLPEGELDDAHDQDQQQRRGEYQLGRDRAAFVTFKGATPKTPSRARWRA